MAKKTKNVKADSTEQAMTGSSVNTTNGQHLTNTIQDEQNENIPPSKPLPTIPNATKGASVTIAEGADVEKVSYADEQQNARQSWSLSRPERHRPKTSAERRRLEMAFIGRGDTAANAELSKTAERRRRRSVASHHTSEVHSDKQSPGCWTITSWIVTFWALPVMLRSFGRSILKQRTYYTLLLYLTFFNF
jgi:hypothetical protein